MKAAPHVPTLNAPRAYVYAVAQACAVVETHAQGRRGAITVRERETRHGSRRGDPGLAARLYQDYPTAAVRDDKLYEIGAGHRKYADADRP